MAGEALRKRKNWQTLSGPGGKAGKAEKNLILALKNGLDKKIYEITDHPTNFKHIYDDVKLSDNTLKQIFCPDKKTMEVAQSRGWGVSPDFSIENKKTGKILFGEIKRQDGWVEGKKSGAGRGNVHERMCKLFTPGLMKAYKKESKITSNEILPFWIVLEGDITRDPKRNRELAFWFDKFDKNYFMWRPQMTDKELIDHFNKNLKKYLD